MDGSHADDGTLEANASRSSASSARNSAFISPAADFLVIFALTVLGAAALLVLL